MLNVTADVFILSLLMWLDTGTTGAVQNLRIIHGADGQIQVQGLLPGQYYHHSSS